MDAEKTDRDEFEKYIEKHLLTPKKIPKIVMVIWFFVVIGWQIGVVDSRTMSKCYDRIFG